MLPLAPCVDGDVVPVHPLEAVRTGAGASCDLLAGTTTEEFNMVFALLGGAVDDDCSRPGAAGDGAVSRGRAVPTGTPCQATRQRTSWARR